MTSRQQVNTVQDILDALRGDPSLGRAMLVAILGEEGRYVPEGLERLLQEWDESRAGIQDLRDSFNLLHERWGQLAGRQYKEEADRVSRRLLTREFGLREPTILYRGCGPGDPAHAGELEGTWEEALAQGAISRDEDQDLAGADLIARGLKNGHTIHLVAEFSIIAGTRHFRRSLRRAGILGKIVRDSQVEAAVVSDSLLPAVDPGDFHATRIELPFRRNELRDAMESANRLAGPRAGPQGPQEANNPGTRTPRQTHG